MIQYRYVIVFLGFLALFNNSITRSNINIALIQMVNQNKTSSSNGSQCRTRNYTNGDSISTFEGEFSWNDQQQGQIFGAYFWGYMLGMIPASHLAQQKGARHVISFAMISYGLLNICLPKLAMINHYGGYAVALTRFTSALLQSGTIPAQQGIMVKWSPLDQASRMIVFQGLGGLFGSMTLFVKGSSIVNTYGWRTLFWVCGITNIISGVIYFSFLRNGPDDCCFISDEEKAHILENRAQAQSAKKKVPYKSMLQSIPFWAAVAPIFNFNLSRTLVMVLYPKYLNDIQGLDLKTVGQLTALPTIVELFTRILGGVAADQMFKSGMNSTSIRNVMAGVAQLVPGIILFGFFFADCSVLTVAILSTSILSFQAFQFAGGIAYVNEICPPYSPAAHSILNSLRKLNNNAQPRCFYRKASVD